MKSSRDRRRYLQWLYQARKRYGLIILNYMVTSNHIHLLVVDDGEKDVIPNSMRLVAGRTGQEFNQRKNRKGAYWEDRYHATAVESGDHLARCMVYIDTNMVRAGVVSHPSMWPFCGYNEIQESRRKNVMIDYERLQRLIGSKSYDHLRESHGGWTASIAVGEKSFVERVKALLGFRAKGRDVVEGNECYQLREGAVSYKAVFQSEKDDIGAENTYFWDTSIRISSRKGDTTETIHLEGKSMALLYRPQTELKTKPSEAQLRGDFENAVKKQGGALLGITYGQKWPIYKMVKDSKEFWFVLMINSGEYFTGPYAYRIIEKRG